jgi:hypothetical protein
MTALALLGKAKGAAAWLVARPRVALVLGVALVALLLVVAWNRARSAEERADAAEARERRAAEASRLKAAGFVVAVGRDRAEMQQQLVALLGERDGLAAEVERFRAAAPARSPRLGIRGARRARRRRPASSRQGIRGPSRWTP